MWIRLAFGRFSRSAVPAGRVSSRGETLRASHIPDCSYSFDFHDAKIRIFFDISKFFTDKLEINPRFFLICYSATVLQFENILLFSQKKFLYLYILIYINIKFSFELFDYTFSNCSTVATVALCNKVRSARWTPSPSRSASGWWGIDARKPPKRKM